VSLIKKLCSAKGGAIQHGGYTDQAMRSRFFLFVLIKILNTALATTAVRAVHDFLLIAFSALLSWQLKIIYYPADFCEAPGIPPFFKNNLPQKGLFPHNVTPT
jgi:hypothetical protein